MSKKISRLILGTVQFGMDYGINNQSGRPSEQEVFAILDAAYDAGIRVLDTARDYGESEKVLGDYLKQSPNKFQILSKFQLKDHTSIRERLEQSLSTLGLDHLESYSFHSTQDFAGFNDFKEIEQIKAEGLVQSFGVSTYSNEDSIKALQNDAIDFIQMPFNMLDNYMARQPVLDLAKKLGKSIHIRSIYLQGLFFKSLSDIQENLPKLKPLIPSLEEIHNIAQSEKLKMEELAFNYPHSIEEISHVVFGVDTLSQLQQNFELLKAPVNESAWNRINNLNVQDKELLSPSNWSS